MKKRKTNTKRTVKHITQSVPFYVISIFFAQFIHTNMIAQPTIGHAVFSLMVSFCISFCLMYAVEFISTTVVNFHTNTVSRIKSLEKIINDKNEKLKETEGIENKLKDLYQRISQLEKGKE